MTQREKQIVLGTLVGLGVAYGGYVGVKSAIIGPFDDLAKQKQAAAARNNSLYQSLSIERGAAANWTARTGKLFSSEADIDDRLFETRQRFLDDISKLLAMHNLEGQAFNFPPPAPPAKNGFSDVPMSVTVTGTMGGLVGFLRDFYLRPYPARIKSLRIAPADPGAATALATATEKHRDNLRPRGHRKDSAAPNSSSATPPERIKITLSMVTLATAPLRGVETSKLPDDFTSVKRIEREGDPRAAFIAANGNDASAEGPTVAMLDWFRKTPPPPPPPPPVDTTPKVAHAAPPPPPPPPPPDPRKDADKLSVIGTIAFGSTHTVYVRDDRTPGGSIQHVHVGETIDDGKVVLVHPKGMIVRVEEKAPDSGQTLRWVDYFYEIGKDFRSRVHLTEAGLSDVVVRGE